MDFDHVISTIVTGLTWLEGFATTPKQKIDDEGMAAIARIAGRLKVELSKPENVADIGCVAAMAKQDLPSIAAPVASVEPEVQHQAPAHQTPAEFNADPANR